MNKIAVYTSIFGPYDGLLPQRKIEGIDFICFTDQPFKSKTWQVKHIDPVFDDPTRNSRRIKVMPHKFLPDHEISVFIDGNYLIKKDIKPLIEVFLKDHNMAIFDHNQASDARNCVYVEYEAILDRIKLGEKKDDPAVMEAQINKYREDGYPENNGLIFSAVLIRRHHAPDVMATMEYWWNEIQNHSKRDQLSFDYAAWKTNFQFAVVPGDLRRNEWFHMIGAHRKDYSAKLFRYRLKKFFGLIK